jgi:hypothetical protein
MPSARTGQSFIRMPITEMLQPTAIATANAILSLACRGLPSAIDVRASNTAIPTVRTTRIPIMSPNAMVTNGIGNQSITSLSKGTRL